MELIKSVTNVQKYDVLEKRQQWAILFNEYEAVNERLRVLIDGNKTYRKADEIMKEVYFDMEMLSKAFGEEKRKEDQLAMIYSAEQRGKTEGIIEVAKKMINNHIDIDFISKTTGLSYEQIKKLEVN